MLAIASIVIFANIIIAILGGKITPLWIFLYSLQLLTYSVLLDLPQAPATTYFMHLLLDTLRLNMAPDTYSIDAS